MNKSGDCVACSSYYCWVLSAAELCSSGYHRGVALARPFKYVWIGCLMRDKALICSPCSAAKEMMSFFRVHLRTRTETQTHIGRCGHTDSFWFKRILEVESTECCSCIPCRKSYFYLGWRCFAGFLVLFFPHHWRYREEAKKEKRQFLLWQKPNWNAKWDSDDTCEERYWNQMFTQKDTFKSLFRNGTRADMRLNWRCNFNPLLLFREPLTWLLIFD